MVRVPERTDSLAVGHGQRHAACIGQRHALPVRAVIRAGLAALKFEFACFNARAALVVVGRGRHASVDHQRAPALFNQAAPARNLARNAGLAVARDSKVGGNSGGAFQGQRVTQDQSGPRAGVGVVNRGTGRHPDRAGPGVGSADVAQRAAAAHARAVQGQGFAGGDVVAAAAEGQFQGAARGDSGVAGSIAERVFIGNAQDAAVNRGRAVIGVISGKDHDAWIACACLLVLFEARAGAAEDGVDRAVFEVVVAGAEGEHAFTAAVCGQAGVVNRAVNQLHAVKGVVPAREVEGPTIDNQLAAGVDGSVPAEFQRAVFRPGIARVAVGRAERERAAAGLGQAARGRANNAFNFGIALAGPRSG